MANDDWRSEERRKIRSAPAQRPVVQVSPDLREAVKEITGPSLAAKVLALLPCNALPGTPEQFHELERGLVKLAREQVVARFLLAVVAEVHKGEEFVVWTMAEARRRTPLRSRGDEEAEILVAGGGAARIMTPYMEPVRDKSKTGPKPAPGKRGKGGGGLFPVLAALGFLGRVSPLVASEVSHSAALLGSHEEAAQVLKSQGIDLHPDSVRRIVAGVADAGLADRESGRPIDQTFAGKRVVIGVDGGRLRCREEKGGRRRASGYHGYETPWTEPKVFTAYVIDDAGEILRGHDLLPVYEGTLTPWKNAVEILATTLRRHGIQEATQIAIAADGSENIWREAERLIELLGVDRSRVVLFVDFYHAIEHLHEVAALSSRLPGEQQQKQWARKQGKRLKRGRVEEVLQDMEALPTANTDAAEELRKQCQYFRARKDRMRYDQLRRAGLPIGTGAIESVIRRVVNLRLKGPGIFWKPENAERMLYLRCRAKAGRWSEVEAALHAAALVPPRCIRPAVLDHFAA